METKICSICQKKKKLSEFDRKKKWYLSYCKDCRKIKRKQYYQTHREEEIIRAKKYQEKNKEKLKITTKLYQEKNKEHIKAYSKKWEEEHKKYRNEYAKKLNSKRKKKDKVYKLKCQIRTMIATCFKKKKFNKKLTNQKILGCNYETFINYLLQTYKENYGIEWNGIEPVHIDHKKPLKYATTEDEVIKLCHYTNLQLLKAHDNLEKSAKLNWKLQK